MTTERMNIAEIIERFGGTPVDRKGLSHYEGWALGFFHDKRFVSDPNLEMTLQLDITAAAKRYDEAYANTSGASLTAYLKWTLLCTMTKHPSFSYRDLEGKWYRLDRLPLFFPVATGTKERFHEVLIEDACALDWPTFCARYRAGVDRAMREEVAYEVMSAETWSMAHFIGNLPDLQFTALRVNTPAVPVGRPIFYFGKRYRTGDELRMPLFIRFDHSNLDPVAVNRFLKDFEREAAGHSEDA